MADLKISALTGATTPLAGTEVLPIVQSSTTKQVSVANLTAGRAVSVASLAATGTVSGAIVTAAGILQSTSFNLGHAANRVIMSYEGGGNGYIQPYGTSPGAQGSLSIRCMSSDGSLSTIAAQFDASNVTINTGNVVMGTAAKGVNFTANTPAAGMTSQLLNAYEEGTWLPSIKFGGAAVGITYSRQSGTYTKVGNVVTVVFDMRLTSKGSSTGGLTIEGLPFASVGGATAGFAIAQLYFYSGFVSLNKMGTAYTNGSTTLNEPVDSLNVAVADTNFTNSAILFASFTYRAA